MKSGPFFIGKKFRIDIRGLKVVDFCSKLLPFHGARGEPPTALRQ
ncbi:hypothetical protein EV282_2289 [Fictibacillus sp. BK138]|nr:hypothetical protein EV282_2289 [Fictibacillus sp. BK138]